MVGFDRLFGMSTSWMRFIGSTLDLQSRRAAFATAWAKQRVIAGDAPDDHKLLDALAYLETFITGINDVIRAETQAWISEFRGALDELDKQIRAQREKFADVTAADRGALEVVVTNFAQLDGGKLTVLVDGQLPIERTGAQSVVVPGLTPGIARVVLRATIANKAAAVEKACAIEAGKVFRLETALS